MNYRIKITLIIVVKLYNEYYFIVSKDKSRPSNMYLWATPFLFIFLIIIHFS